MPTTQPNGYPSWVYHPTEPAVVVASAEVLLRLPDVRNWSAIPYEANPPMKPPPIVPGTVLEFLAVIYALLLAQVPPASLAAVEPVVEEPEVPEESEPLLRAKHRRSEN